MKSAWPLIVAVLVAIAGLLPAGQAGASVSEGDTGAIAGVDGAVSIQVSPGPWTCVSQSNKLW